MFCVREILPLNMKFSSSSILHVKGRGSIPRKFSNADSLLVLTAYLKERLIGLVLGDMSIEKATPNSNVRLLFDNSSHLHSDYLYFLYGLFKDYTLTPPRSTNRKPDNRTGKTYNSLIFKTRMLPCFN
jgi:hypothetical protein